MKRIILFFTVCLGLSVFQTTDVVFAETTRSAIKRDTNISLRQKSEKNRLESSKNVPNPRNNITSVQSRSASSSRSSTKAKSGINENTVKTTVARTKNTDSSRGAILTRSGITAKTPTLRNTISGKTTSRKSTRATELNDEKISVIKSQNYSKCKSIYYDCMDEFCANKDASLRRCACSSRIHEFDTIKKQLNQAEDKMMDFNQRLLIVGLDKEDAAAVNVATEGEVGYSKKDTSRSEKTLKNITDALNSSGNSKINNDLSAISLSLDVDSAWDSIDSLAGVSTTSKSGLDLYNAAIPICVEMSKEVCSDHELEVTQNSYKLMIQQDCNTVAKSYDTKYNQTIEKIHESSALLDMSRLNAYQQRNSDDILTCKKKILDKMSESSVCGQKLQKCLDVTGQYINPATGDVFLSDNLYNIANLLTAPTGNETWSGVPQNQQFISFLNSKKTFLEPAIQQCQDIADTVWKDFLNDALSQIKLAQNAKIEEIRQSCTTLVAECKSGTRKILTDFDARALSTFEVMADTTTNAICTNVENSCTALLNSSGGGGNEWVYGISGIAADISYDSIINNCTTVGRDCIIQQCNGTGGNFALCGDYSAAPRRAILRHNACWNEVLACVQQSANLENINTPITQNRNAFYNDLYSYDSYSLDVENIPRPCPDDDKACLITEQIWGNCEHNPSTSAITTNENLLNSENDIFSQNMILQPVSDEKTTLLSWLAYNTGTTDARDSCSAYNCPINYKYDENAKTCKRMVTTNGQTSDNHDVTTMDEIFYVTNIITNFCAGGITSKDNYGNCCASRAVSNGICVPSSEYNAVLVQQISCDSSVNLNYEPKYYCADYTPNPTENPEYYTPDDKQMYLYCVTPTAPGIDNNAQLTCNDGYLVIVDQYGNYMPAATINSTNNFSQISTLPTMSYSYAPIQNSSDSVITCTYTYTNSDGWKWKNGSETCTTQGIVQPVPKNNLFMITY